MKIFISHSNKDKKYEELIAMALKNEGHEIINMQHLEQGISFLHTTFRQISIADAVILIISCHSSRSNMTKKEFSAIAMRTISSHKQKIIPVIIDNESVPSYLSEYLYVDISSDIDAGIRRIVELLKPEKLPKLATVEDGVQKKQQEEAKERKIHDLARALHGGRLTLICGAGVSVGAGVPTWDSLLLRLLRAMISRISEDQSLPLNCDDADRFQAKYAPSSLVTGKYLKNFLGKDFLPKLREALYTSDSTSCDVLDAIVDLARPQRDGKPLDSIITFNFDDLLEENLKQQNIKYKIVYGEGVRNSPSELPIYHVHGYLPRTGSVPNDREIVFSEDAYHSQFIEPFSWSNLIQLNKLSQNTCLFIGLSLTDPNLRRLLDVAHRKNPEKCLNHYIIKKSPVNTDSKEPMDRLALLLEEQDAIELGLNVVWVHEYSEIPQILKEIATTSSSNSFHKVV